MKKCFLNFLIMISPVVALSQEHARVLSSTTTYDFISTDEVEVSIHQKIRIKSKQGYDHAVIEDYYDKFKKIPSMSLTVFNTQGKKVERITKFDALDIALNDDYEVSDNRLLYIDSEYDVYPFTVEINKKIKYKSSMWFPEWMPRNSYYLAIDSAKLIINLEKGQNVRIDTAGSFQFQHKIDDSRNTYIFKLSGLEPVDKSLHRREFYNAQAKVRIAPNKFEMGESSGNLDTWKEYGDWYYELNDFPNTISEETKQFIAGLSEKQTKEKIATIYDYLQNTTRYISIQLGIGGFKSMPSNEVESYGYGDCKGLSTYMKAMLDYAGIPSNYVLVYAGEEVRDIDKNFPSNQFNHVFIGVPLQQDTVFLECTSQDLPADFLGTFTDDRNVLWIEKGGSQIIRSPAYGADINSQVTMGTIKIDDEGKADMDIEIENNGVFFEDYSLYEAAPDHYIKEYNHALFDFKDFEILDFAYERGDGEVPVFKSKFKLNVRNLSRSIGSNQVIPTNLFGQIESYFTSYDKYANFAMVHREIGIEQEYEIKLDEGYRVVNTADDLFIDNEYCTYSFSTRIEKNKVLVKKKIVLRKGRYSGDDFLKIKNVVDQIKKKENTKLLIRKGT